MEKAACVRKEALAAPEEATPTLTAPPTLMKTVGEEPAFLESAKDYFNRFKAMPAHKYWISGSASITTSPRSAAR